MLYIIKMTEDKTLITTVKTNVYQGEENADMLRFLIPKIYDNKDISTCNVFLKYILPDEENEDSIKLTLTDDNYKDFYCYATAIDISLTKSVGIVKLRIGIINEKDDFTLKTSEVYMNVRPVIIITDDEDDNDDDDVNGLHFIVQEDFE